MDEQKYNLEQSIAELDKLLDLSAEETDKTTCEALAEKARIIYEQYPESEEIALRYARILFNLSTDQTGLKELETTAEKLEKLQQKFQDSHDIALQYARILFNLSSKQTDLKEIEATAEKLEKLQQQKFQDSHDIAEAFAMILVNLSAEQTGLKELETTAKKIEKLQQKFQDSHDIALQYAMILFNLSITQTGLKELETTAKKLQKLQQKFQDSHDIALQYAMVLFILSTEQTGLKELETTAEKLEKLQQKFQDSHDIAEAFARILVILSTVQTGLKEQMATAKKLEKLQQKFQDSHDIALLYAMILFNLSTKQTGLKEQMATAKKLQKLHEHERFQESEEIAFIYGMFLAILFNHQTELSARRQTTKIIKKLYEEFSNFMLQNFDDLFFSNENVCDSEEYMLFNFILREGLLKNTKYAILQKWTDRYKEDSSELKNLLSIYQLVQKIKYQLGLKDEDKNQVLKFGHYTKGSTLQIMLDQEENDKKDFSVSGKTRLYNANYMNDPEEGIVIEQILGLDRRDVLEPSSWFLMSFTSKTDDLAMWSQYGNNAEGVCIVLNENDFAHYHSLSDLPWYQKNSDKQISHKMNSNVEIPNDISLNESGKEMTIIGNENVQISEGKHSISNNNRDYLYRVAYVHYSDDQFDIEETELFTSEEVTRLKGLLVDLKSELRDYKNSGDPFYKKAIADCIEEIRYLFKSVDYKYEEELRILEYANLNSDNDKIKIDYSPEFGKLYLEREENIQIGEVIFGPKFPNPEYVTPLLKLLDKNIKYKKSTIKFR